MKKGIVLFLILFSVAWAQKRPKIGLVLSGGGARGAAHVPVLKLLDSLKIPIDYIAGTSMGGLAGAFYALGYSGKRIEKILVNANWDELFSDLPPRQDQPYFVKYQKSRYQLDFGLKGIAPVPPLGLIEGEKIALFFSKETFPYSQIHDFSKLPIPFRCVAVDLISGKEAVLEKGSLPKAMRATMSIPSVFNPVEWGDSLLIDGGVINNLPVDVVKKMGADIVIAVNVGTPLKKRHRLRSTIDIFEQAFNIPGSYREEENLKQVDVLVKPALELFSSSDFAKDKLNAIVKAGRDAARKAIPQLLELKKNISRFHTIDIRRDSLKQTGYYKKPIIYSLSISGNRKLSFSFIYQFLGIAPGEVLDIARLDRGIQLLYSLNYFKTIQYDIVPLKPGRIHLQIHVKERLFRRLRIGFRYDDYRKIVLAVKMQGTNILFPGLRGELEYQFPGISRLSYRVSYPSVSLNQPIYPYLRAKHENTPKIGYDENGDEILTYAERYFQAGLGLGFLLFDALNVQAEFNFELNHSSSIISAQKRSFNDNLRKIRIDYHYDTLDDVFIPHSGMFLSGGYEVSDERLGSKLNYWRFQSKLQYYFSLTPRHTLHFSGFLGLGRSLPLYKKFSLGGMQSFVGGQYDQFGAREAAIAGVEYRWRYKKDIYLKAVVNTMFKYKFIDKSISNSKANILGFGLGVKFLSLLGPIEFVFARGEKSFVRKQDYQNVFYMKAGYLF